MPVYNTKFILLNGPAGVGKTIDIAPLLCKLLTENLYDNDQTCVVRDSFAAPMKHFVASAMGMRYNDMKKNSPQAVWNGFSIREVLIGMSETHMKTKYGEDIFGRLLLHRVMNLEPLPHAVVIDDNGFESEADALDPHRKNIILVKIERPGYTYKGDSRDYLPDPDYVLKNDGDLEQLKRRVSDLADAIIASSK